MDDLKIGDVILSRDLKTVELVITDLSERFMIDNEVNYLLSNGKLYSPKDKNEH